MIKATLKWGGQDRHQSHEMKLAVISARLSDRFLIFRHANAQLGYIWQFIYYFVHNSRGSVLFGNPESRFTVQPTEFDWQFRALRVPRCTSMILYLAPLFYLYISSYIFIICCCA
jgi:hypothetical protein